MVVVRDPHLVPLALFADKAHTVPLRDALAEVADAWTLRIGTRIRVVEEPFVGSGGYRIERST